MTVATFGPAAPVNAPGQSLYLVRYEIAPGTRLRPHHHEGTQIGLVAAGELIYHVLVGDVPVYRIGPDGNPVLDRTLRAGTFATVAAGEWLGTTGHLHLVAAPTGCPDRHAGPAVRAEREVG